MRNKELLKEVISQILEAICEQEAVVKKYKGHIPQIELDMIMENIRKLYENFQFLNKYNQELIAEEEEEGISEERILGIETEEEEGRVEKGEWRREEIAAEVEKEVEELSLPEETLIEEEEIFIPKSSIDIGFERIEEEEDKRQKAEGRSEERVLDLESVEKEFVTEGRGEEEVELVEIETTVVDENMITPSNYKPVTTMDLFSDAGPTVADTLKRNEKTVYDKIGNGDDDSVVSKIQKVPIQDLKSHIGINDRFLFMNELFMGNMKEYNDAIECLNNFNNLEEALSYFEELGEKYQMNEAQDSFIRLMDFIQRRYL